MCHRQYCIPIKSEQSSKNYTSCNNSEPVAAPTSATFGSMEYCVDATARERERDHFMLFWLQESVDPALEARDSFVGIFKAQTVICNIIEVWNPNPDVPYLCVSQSPVCQKVYDYNPHVRFHTSSVCMMDWINFIWVGGARGDRHLWGFSASCSDEVSSKSSQTWAVWGGCCAALHRSTDPTFSPRSGPSHPRCWCAHCAQECLRRRKAPVLATGLRPTQRKPPLHDVTFSHQEGWGLVFLPGNRPFQPVRATTMDETLTRTCVSVLEHKETL